MRTFLLRKWKKRKLTLNDLIRKIDETILLTELQVAVAVAMCEH